MNIARAGEAVKGIAPTNFNKQDSYERSIQKQIEILQEKSREIANNKDLPAERKIKEKKEIEDQIMQLNQDLQQYKTQKRQKEEAKTQETLKQAANNNKVKNENEKTKTGLSESETGVILSLSSTQEQVNNIKKVRTELEGKLRTAKTDGDKIELQDKIAELNEEISKRIGDNQNLIKDYHKEKQQDNKKNRQDTKLQDIKGEEKNTAELTTDKTNTDKANTDKANTDKLNLDKTKLDQIKSDQIDKEKTTTEKLSNTEGMAHAAGQDKEEEEEWKSVKERDYKNM